VATGRDDHPVFLAASVGGQPLSWSRPWSGRSIADSGETVDRSAPQPGVPLM